MIDGSEPHPPSRSPAARHAHATHRRNDESQRESHPGIASVIHPTAESRSRNTPAKTSRGMQFPPATTTRQDWRRQAAVVSPPGGRGQTPRSSSSVSMRACANPRRLSSSLISQLAVDFPTPAAPVMSKISRCHPHSDCPIESSTFSDLRSTAIGVCATKPQMPEDDGGGPRTARSRLGAVSARAPR